MLRPVRNAALASLATLAIPRHNLADGAAAFVALTAHDCHLPPHSGSPGGIAGAGAGEAIVPEEQATLRRGTKRVRPEMEEIANGRVLCAAGEEDPCMVGAEGVFHDAQIEEVAAWAASVRMASPGLTGQCPRVTTAAAEAVARLHAAQERTAQHMHAARVRFLRPAVASAAAPGAGPQRPGQ